MVVGERLKRKDAGLKVTGQAPYVYDLSFADEQYLEVVRSPYAHARIKNMTIDYQKLKKMGITAGTAAEVPGKNVLHVIHDDWPLLAEKVVRHVGEPVVVLVGPSVQITKKGREYVSIEYEEIPAVFDPVEAKDNKSVHIFGENNVCSYWQQKNGDIEKDLLNQILF